MVSWSPRQSPLFFCVLLACALWIALAPKAAAQPFQVADVNPGQEVETNVFFLFEPMVALGGELFSRRTTGSTESSCGRPTVFRATRSCSRTSARAPAAACRGR